MIRYLIIDDEPVAHDIIQDYCEKLPHLTLAGHCYDALEALDFFTRQSVDLIFLDLNMPKLKGFEFLKTLSKPPKIIVTTAYQEYALEGYELDVVDYLLKPFDFTRFLKAVNKVVNPPVASAASASQSTNDRSILVRSDKQHVRIHVPDILYLEAAGNYTKIVTEEKVVLIRGKLSELVRTIDSKELIQVHKSFIIAKSHIDAIAGNRIQISRHTIPIGKVYKANVDGLLG